MNVEPVSDVRFLSGAKNFCVFRPRGFYLTVEELPNIPPDTTYSGFVIEFSCCKCKSSNALITRFKISSKYIREGLF